MSSTSDKRIDVYIAKAQPFVQPILSHLRRLVHRACPNVEETIKWGMPYFTYKGEMMCGMASFKQHCAFIFWKALLMKEKKLLRNAQAESAMGHLGRITSLNDIPSDKVMISYIKEARQLNDDGVKIKKASASKEKKKLIVPNYFSSAVEKNKKASAVFNTFTYSNKKEYVEWVTEAKIESTRLSRLATAVKWIAEGKTRNWKYVQK